MKNKNFVTTYNYKTKLEKQHFELNGDFCNLIDSKNEFAIISCIDDKTYFSLVDKSTLDFECVDLSTMMNLEDYIDTMTLSYNFDKKIFAEEETG